MLLTLLTLHSTTTERTTERTGEVPAEFQPVLYSCYSANWNSAGTSLSFLWLSAVVLQRVRSARKVSPAHIPRAPPHTPCAPPHTTCAPPHLPHAAQGTVQLLLSCHLPVLSMVVLQRGH